MSGQQRKNEARERARIRREQERRKARQRRMATYSGIIVTVIAVIAAVVIVAVVTHHKDKNANVVATSAVSAGIAGVAAANYDQVGTGTATGGLRSITGQPPLTANGKPEVLYVGAEYCPYCAAERWAIATALARFGTFSGLQTTKSSSTDVFPNTPTLSFLTASYTSDYITFTTREIQDRAGKALQKLTADQSAIFSKIAPKGGIPFLDIANRYFLNGTQYDPSVLKGLTPDEVAQQLGNPGTPIGKAVLGSANLLTAAVCAATDNKPTNVCTSAAVTTAAKSLTTGSASGSS